MRFIVEQGYFKIGCTVDGVKHDGGWVCSEDGSMYAIARIDKNDKQIGEGVCCLNISDIPKRIMELTSSQEGSGAHE